MKYDKEIKVGIVVTLAIAGLVWGINYLKGSDLFSTSNDAYIVYRDVNGLVKSNGIFLNGIKVGQVKNQQFFKDNSGRILVTITIDKKVFVSKDTRATIINSDLLGGKAIALTLGQSSVPLQDEDTLSGDIAEGLGAQIEPLKIRATNALISVDSLAQTLSSVLTKEGIASLNASLKNLESVTHNLSVVSQREGSLMKSMSNLESITTNIKNNNKKIEEILTNLNTVSAEMASSDLKKTIDNLEKTSAQVNDILGKINKGEGSLGKLMKDEALYNNLNAAAANLDKLLIDLKANPKRYVQVSVFGRKDKNPAGGN